MGRREEEEAEGNNMERREGRGGRNWKRPLPLDQCLPGTPEHVQSALPSALSWPCPYLSVVVWIKWMCFLPHKLCGKG